MLMSLRDDGYATRDVGTPRYCLYRRDARLLFAFVYYYVMPICRCRFTPPVVNMLMLR